MTIKNTFILHAIIIIGLPVAIGLLALHDVEQLVAMIRFTEIQEEINASLFEMRLMEKNYFLFKDGQAIHDITKKISEANDMLDEKLTQQMLRTIGQEQYRDLRRALRAYRGQAEDIASAKATDQHSETALRAAGQNVLKISADLTKGTRYNIEGLIASTKLRMIGSFLVFLVLAAFGILILFRILSSLNKVSRLALEIAEGRFCKIDGPVHKDECGAVITALNTMTEQLRSREDELVQSKKLNSLGFLTAGVAHELNNPLNNISMIVQTLDAMYDSLRRNERLDLVRQIGDEAERIQSIVMDLLDFAKPKATVFQPEGINAVVRRSVKLVRNMLDVSNIEVVLELTARLPLVNMDVNQICQVLVNLFNNAIHAMPAGKTLTVRTRLEPVTGMVEIEVQDTGHGMTPKVLGSIFDPFFSTKGTDGTGLGLSVSYGIIKNHQGHISAQSEVGKGTTFNILLPGIASGEVENE